MTIKWTLTIIEYQRSNISHYLVVGIITLVLLFPIIANIFEHNTNIMIFLILYNYVLHGIISVMHLNNLVIQFGSRQESVFFVFSHIRMMGYFRLGLMSAPQGLEIGEKVL